LDGNASDKVSLLAAVEALAEQLRAANEAEAAGEGAAPIFVAASGLYSADNVARLTTAGVRWISRVPDTSTEAHAALAVTDDAWQHTGTLFWAPVASVPTGERWVVVRTTPGEARARATLQRQVERVRHEWEQALWHLRNRRFACEPDAQAALDQQLKQRPEWLDVQTRVTALPTYRRPGHPRKDAPPDRTEWHIEATLSVNEEAVARAARRKAAFLVATNVLDPTLLSDQELIATYKEQGSVEIVCSQMTKTNLLAGWSSWDHVVNRHIGVGDDHPVDEELDKVPLLLPGRLGEARSHPRTQRFHGLHDASQVLLPARFRLKLVHLSRHCMKLLLHRLASALILLQGHHLVHVGIREALYLAL
jgi:hypothetical protein